MAAVRWSDEAEQDLARILDVIAERNPAAADRMQGLFAEVVERLPEHPLACREGRIPGT